MREKIKDIFLQSGHQFVSGEDIGKQLNISRTAVWKHIEELKREGFHFEAIRRKGYRLVNDPDDISPERLKNQLLTKWLGKEILFIPEVESTQRVAHEIARNGAEHGTVVMTDEQTNGKGRLGRSWFSQKGKGIWMSMVIRPEFFFQQTPQITLVTSVILSRTLNELYPGYFMIKWPNDIFLNGRKISGILTEIHGEQDQIHYMIIGIGINTHKVEFPHDLQEKATSIEEEVGVKPKRMELIQNFFLEFERQYAQFVKEGFNSFYPYYNEHLFGKGRRITVNQFTKSVEGEILRINEEGYLILKQENGQEVNIISGDLLL
ncbi:biotin--[acetyl-CoA-carboxylase] ligase [Tepidibacillus marianensis]|uniref:biotin--[acetyl-CoA-carboxylase] ligase n=1 Tax=Tepidibacillus marianensis TaxID=3131995 RepID=UPI0030D43DE5